ncbi:MAG: methyltransferase domain-containing protein [Rhodospirillaceae bacterium]|nr:methyltransferase domain-containing protein [Rhodospirillaceae bacterium]
MRKDYMVATDSETDETGFVEAHWTKVWEQEGGPQGRIDRISRQNEYRLMAPHLKTLPQGSRILDGGCGLGDWVMALNRDGFSTVGLDLSRKTVAQLQSRFPETEFAAGDIRATDFADESFDAYFSWGVFEHFENGPQDCIREARRILKPGGLLFVSVPMDNFRHAIRGTFARPQPISGTLRFYQYRFTRAELAQELSLGGFDVTAVHPIHKRQGVLRHLHHEFGLPYSWLLTRGLAAVLAPFIPGTCIAHMVLAIARKPVTTSAGVPA